MDHTTISKAMFYGAKPEIFEKAKLLRLNMTSSEKILWTKLNNNQILGLRFKSQHPINQFIADFYCHSIQLVIEIDGEIHNSVKNIEYDSGREFEMKKFGITTLRFTNDKVIEHLDKVISEITDTCNRLMNSEDITSLPPRPLKGE